MNCLIEQVCETQMLMHSNRGPLVALLKVMLCPVGFHNEDNLRAEHILTEIGM